MSMRQFSGATWFKRNGAAFLNNAYIWWVNGVTAVEDLLGLSTGVVSFDYTPAGQSPVGSTTDSIPHAVSPVSFDYTPAGQSPVGSTTDSIPLSTGVVSFSYA